MRHFCCQASYSEVLGGQSDRRQVWVQVILKLKNEPTQGYKGSNQDQKVCRMSQCLHPVEQEAGTQGYLPWASSEWQGPVSLQLRSLLLETFACLRLGN